MRIPAGVQIERRDDTHLARLPGDRLDRIVMRVRVLVLDERVVQHDARVRNGLRRRARRK
jgi:hypothetical protein